MSAACDRTVTHREHVRRRSAIGQSVGLREGVADRLGDRRAMVAAAGVAILCFGAILTTHSLGVLGPALTVIGFANATYYLGRVSSMTDVVPLYLRARPCRRWAARTGSACSSDRSSARPRSAWPDCGRRTPWPSWRRSWPRCCCT
jgi:hypothetical protein